VFGAPVARVPRECLSGGQGPASSIGERSGRSGQSSAAPRISARTRSSSLQRPRRRARGLASCASRFALSVPSARRVVPMSERPSPGEGPCALRQRRARDSNPQVLADAGFQDRCISHSASPPRPKDHGTRDAAQRRSEKARLQSGRGAVASARMPEDERSLNRACLSAARLHPVSASRSRDNLDPDA
jgi:hypothetical protein